MGVDKDSFLEKNIDTCQVVPILKEDDTPQSTPCTHTYTDSITTLFCYRLRMVEDHQELPAQAFCLFFFFYFHNDAKKEEEITQTVSSSSFRRIEREHDVLFFFCCP